MIYDLVIHDTVGRPYVGDTTKGIGGSEHFVQKLGKRLAERGLSVLVLNASGVLGPVWTGDGVTYADYRAVGEVECKTLLLQRATPLPMNVAFEKLLVQVHDAPTTPDLNLIGAYLERLGATLVCVSDYQRSLYPEGWKARLIYPILHDLPAPIPKDETMFLYASAACKGWPETLSMWQAFRRMYPKLRDARLHVIESGYDEPLRVSDPSVVYLGKLADNDLLTYLNLAAAIFYVNTMVEMFPVPVALARYMGARIHALCLNGVGGMAEAAGVGKCVTTDHDLFRESVLAAYGTKTRSGIFGATSVRAVDRWMEMMA
jgi:hypothetical protein